MPNGVKPPAGVVSKTGYAQHRGCSPAYVSKLIRLGKLAAPALLADGRINVILADQMLGAPGAEELALPAAPAAPPAAAARAEREAAQARLARVRADEAEGKLLRRHQVEPRVFDLVRRFRDEILAWPDALAPRLTTMTSERAIADVLRAELEDKLSRLADELEELAAHDAAADAEAEAPA